LNFSGPKWKELTGIDVRVIEVPTAEMFTKILQEHRAGSGAYDALNVIPAWMPDLVRAGALEPLDEYVDRYGFRDELQTIAPVYRDNQMTFEDTIYSFPDDGDVFVLYYRTDVLGDPDIQAAFAEAHGYDLPMPPTDWQQFLDVACFITGQDGGTPYGAGLFRDAPYTQFMLQERFRVNGGRFFEPETMQATINSEAGLEAFEGMLAENQCMPAGARPGLRREPGCLPPGRHAMTISWPPYGRWPPAMASRGCLLLGPALAGRGQCRLRADPGRPPAARRRFRALRLLLLRNKEAAYLFIQWLNSEDISIDRVQLPYALRDPFRDSHFVSEEYKSRWPRHRNTWRRSTPVP
jgi:multiple sugar transport system substrate-binding protein